MRPEDAARVKAVVGVVPGVKRIIEASPGEGARLEAQVERSVAKAL